MTGLEMLPKWFKKKKISSVYHCVHICIITPCVNYGKFTAAFLVNIIKL